MPWRRAAAGCFANAAERTICMDIPFTARGPLVSYALLHKRERFVKDDRAVKRLARTSRIRRNDANLAIPQCAIELLGAIPLARIEHEQRSPPRTRDLLNGLHERSPDPSTALT